MLQAGFADPVREGQRVFRAVLQAMAHPGRVVPVATSAPSPPPLAPATVAVALTLLDHDTPLWLDAAAATPAVVEHLRFHCGAPLASSPGQARFAIVVDVLPPLEAFDRGTDERPDRSTTVIVQVAGLRAGGGRRLSGPGIAGEARLEAAGAPGALWQELRANRATFPRGVDVILCAGRTVAALPRTTRVED